MSDALILDLRRQGKSWDAIGRAVGRSRNYVTDRHIYLTTGDLRKRDKDGKRIPVEQHKKPGRPSSFTPEQSETIRSMRETRIVTAYGRRIPTPWEVIAQAVGRGWRAVSEHYKRKFEGKSSGGGHKIDRKPEHTVRLEPRKCLRCGEVFLSWGPQNRLCTKQKDGGKRPSCTEIIRNSGESEDPRVVVHMRRRG